MVKSFIRACKTLSITAALVLLFFGVTLVSDEPVKSDVLRAAAFVLYALSLVLNLFRVRKSRAIVLAALHAAAVVYLGISLVRMTLIAFMEAGSKLGLWQFFWPIVLLLLAFASSVILNFGRARGGFQNGS